MLDPKLISTCVKDLLMDYIFYMMKWIKLDALYNKYKMCEVIIFLNIIFKVLENL